MKYRVNEGFYNFKYMVTSSKFLGPICVLRNGSMPPCAPCLDSEGGV